MAEHDFVYSVAIDAAGNAYVAGYTSGAFPGVTSAGGADAYLAKVGAGGDILWIQQFGTPSSDLATSVAIDTAGEAYVSGYAFGAFPGETSAGYDDAFHAKVSPGGDVLWTHQFGTSTTDWAYSAAFDAAGLTEGTFPGETSAGSQDAFVAKVGSGGDVLWAQQLGTSDYDFIYSVALDAAGIAYVAGITEGTFPGETSAGNRDAFLAKVDTK